MIRILLGAAALAATLPVQASAQAVEEKNLLSGKAKIEADSGYIYVSGPIRQQGMLLRLPDAETIAAYEKDWAEALDKVQKKYPAKVKNCETKLLLAQQKKTRLPEKPIEPTPENFAIGPIEMRDPASFGPQFVFAKGKETEHYSYLMKVKPGRYVYYGPIFWGANGAFAGSCYCMGSVAFDVKAGTITDTGNFFLVGSGTDPDFPARPEKQPGSEMGLYRPIAGSEQWGALAFGLPETLKAYPNEQADFRAHGKIDNFYKVTVGRMPPVAGVLAYERDKIIDLKASADAPSAEAAQDADPIVPADTVGTDEEKTKVAESTTPAVLP